MKERMKKIIYCVINGLLLGLLLLFSTSVKAQLLDYPAVYPSLPFDLAKAQEMGYNKCTVWKGQYQRTEEDESGIMWTTVAEESYQYQRYIFGDQKVDKVITYIPSGDKLWSMEYFYRKGESRIDINGQAKENLGNRKELLSAIERLEYGEEQIGRKGYTMAYYYRPDNTPFQRVTMYKATGGDIRVLDEFELDTLGQLKRKRTTAVGRSPHMDSLVGLNDGEKRLTIVRKTDSTLVEQVYENLNTVLDDRETHLNDEGLALQTVVRNSNGEMLMLIDYQYEAARLYKKQYWVIKRPPAPEKRELTKKELRQKRREERKDPEAFLKAAAAAAEEEPVVSTKPELYKVEYFEYDEDGLLIQHIVEENGVQVIWEYTYFSE